MKTKLIKRIAGVAIVAIALGTLAYSVGVFIGSMTVLPEYQKLQQFEKELHELRAYQN